MTETTEYRKKLTEKMKKVILDLCEKEHIVTCGDTSCQVKESKEKRYEMSVLQQRKYPGH